MSIDNQKLPFYLHCSKHWRELIIQLNFSDMNMWICGTNESQNVCNGEAKAKKKKRFCMWWLQTNDLSLSSLTDYSHVLCFSSMVFLSLLVEWGTACSPIRLHRLLQDGTTIHAVTISAVSLSTLSRARRRFSTRRPAITPGPTSAPLHKQEHEEHCKMTISRLLVSSVPN